MECGKHFRKFWQQGIKCMNKIKISPSILSADLSNVNSEIKQVERYSQLIHIDIMDGIFVPKKTIDASFVKKIKTKIPLDIHLMVQEPSEKYILDFIKAGGSIIAAHQEACSNLEKILKFIKKNKSKASIAIKPNTPVSSIKKYLDMVDVVLVMTVEPGKSGQKFIQSPLKKVKELRKLNPNLDIEVDGGINPHTAKLCARAGANVFVAGTAIFGQKDRAKAIKELRESVR